MFTTANGVEGTKAWAGETDWAARNNEPITAAIDFTTLPKAGAAAAAAADAKAPLDAKKPKAGEEADEKKPKEDDEADAEKPKEDAGEEGKGEAKKPKDDDEEDTTASALPKTPKSKGGKSLKM